MEKRKTLEELKKDLIDGLLVSSHEEASWLNEIAEDIYLLGFHVAEEGWEGRAAMMEFKLGTSFACGFVVGFIFIISFYLIYFGLVRP